MRLTFDHGTLVFLEAPDLDFGFVPGAVWDGRVALWRAPAHEYLAVVTALRSRNLAFEDEARGWSWSTTEEWADVELRPYQRAALVAWEAAGRRGLVVLPTGSGKTRVALAMMAELGMPTLCLVPTRALLQQWHAELSNRCSGAVGIWGDGERVLAPITVSTFESAYRTMPEIGARFAVLVVDEAHHFGAGIRDETLEMCAAPVRLGLTATPPEGPALARLEQILGRVVFRLGVTDLAGSYLSAFDLVLLKLALEPDERARYETDHRAFSEVFKRLTRANPGLGWDEFRLLAASSPEGREAMAAWRRSRRLLALTKRKSAAVSSILHRHHDAKVLVFTADNESAYRIARRNLVMPITCDISRKEREGALEAFREGRLRALVSSRVLNEGIDVPDADVAVIVGGTRSEREHVQRVGRLLRPAPGKRALVYELVASSTREEAQSIERRRGLVLAHTQLA